MTICKDKLAFKAFNVCTGDECTEDGNSENSNADSEQDEFESISAVPFFISQAKIIPPGSQNSRPPAFYPPLTTPPPRA
jgi:hypothetical protein